MKLQMHNNSLFAVLLRSPWWVAGLVAAGAFGVARIFLPWELAAFGALPFAVITAYVAWKQLRAPSGRRIARTLERLRAMSWDEFAQAIEKGFSRDGYTVKRLAGKGADFELVQGSRRTLLARRCLTGCARLKSALKARARVVSRRFARYRRSVWKFRSLRIARRCRTMGAGRARNAASNEKI